MANEYVVKSNASVLLDDLVRRSLKVDPRDPEEVAKALLDYYPEEKIKLELESKGFAVAPGPSEILPAPSGAAQCALEADLSDATSDLDHDLDALVEDQALRKAAAGLRGWAQSVRAVVSEGLAAARLAVEPRQRGKVFGARRELGDYARLARYVGVLSVESNGRCRRAARTIDRLASLMLVIMGGAISRQAAGGFLMQVSLTDIQARRAGVINALRNLLGSVDAALGDEGWGRGRTGYRLLYEKIDRRNQPDLKALLLEPELSRMMNDAIDVAATNTLEGAAALGARVAASIDKMERLLRIICDLQDEKGKDNLQPPLFAFYEALRLFVGAFDIADTPSGIRLVEIAMPQIVLHGRCSGGEINKEEEEVREALKKLIDHRKRLADALDDYLHCEGTRARVESQVVLDKLLFDVDRAIDLYVQGTKGWGEPENRAVAYAELLSKIEKKAATSKTPLLKEVIEEIHSDSKIVAVLGNVSTLLNQGGRLKNIYGDEEYQAQFESESNWRKLIRLTISCKSR